MLVGKAGSLPNTEVGSILNHKYLAVVEKLARDKTLAFYKHKLRKKKKLHWASGGGFREHLAVDVRQILKRGAKAIKSLFRMP